MNCFVFKRLHDFVIARGYGQGCNNCHEASKKYLDEVFAFLYERFVDKFL